MSYLISLHSTLQYLHHQLEYDELNCWATHSSHAHIDATLLGSSSKRLFVHMHDTDGSPAALHVADSPPTFVTGPAQLKQCTVDYFTNLFHYTPQAPSVKPWLDTPSMQSICTCIAHHPFSWPQTLFLLDLHFLLRRGNLWPAPGPDLWEKWCVCSLADSSLTLVLNLVNYQIATSHFSACVKPTIMSTIFKHGPCTGLSNYCGITCTNLLKNLPFAWLNHLLSHYLSTHHILLQTQIATQPGVQAQDLTSFLSHVESSGKTPFAYMQ